jgi:hypothetical protein
MRKLAKNKIFTSSVVLMVIVWAIGISAFIPLFDAQAASVGIAESWVDSNWNQIPSGGMMPIAGFQITGTGTLNSIKIQMESIEPADIDPATILSDFNGAGAPGDDMQGVSIYEDTNGNGAFEPGQDDVLVWETQPVWASLGGGAYEATLDIVDDQLSSSVNSEYDSNYFVHINASESAPAAYSFKFVFPTDSIVTSEGTVNITQFGTSTISTMGDTDDEGYMPGPHIQDLWYMGPTSLLLTFQRTMDPATVNCNSALACADIYTLITDKVGDNQSVTAAALQADNQSVLLTASAAFITPSFTDTITINTDPENGTVPSDTDGVFYGDSYPFSPMMYWNGIEISEVQVAGTETVDEFIEIYNSSNGVIDLEGHKIAAMAGGTFAELVTFGATTIPAGGYVLVANTNGTFAGSADETYDGTDLNNNDSIIYLNFEGGVNQPTDIVGIGTSASVYEGNPFATSLSAGQSVERKASWDSTAATMAGADGSIGNAYDSDDNSFDFVVRTSSDPQASTDDPEAAAVEDNETPYIDHMPVVNATASQDLNLYAYIDDREDTFMQLSEVKLCYRIEGQSWDSNNCTDGTLMHDVVFTVPASSVTAVGLEYYIKVIDSDIAEVYACAEPGATNESACQSAPYSVNVSSTTGTRVISGTVYEDDCTTPISGVNVYVEGTGISGTSDGSGVFSIRNVFDGNHNLRATGGGYMEQTMWGVTVNDNNPRSTGWDFCLSSGTAGQGGDITSPHVYQTAPFPDMQGAPQNIAIDEAPILIFFDKEMDESTVTCSSCDASNASTNVKLKVMEQGQIKSLGSAADSLQAFVYNVGLDTGSGVSGQDFGGSTNTPVAVIYMNQLLVTGRDYIVEVTGGVRDSAGNSVDGNRAGAGYEFSFGTSFTTHNDFGSFDDFMDEAYDSTTGMFAGGMYSPPFIFGSNPRPGAWDVPTNTSKITFEFDKSMDSTTITTTYFKIYDQTAGGTDVTSSLVSSVSLSSDKKNVTMNLGTDLTTDNQYQLEVRNGAKSDSGITLGDPGNLSGPFYISEFNTSALVDETSPTIVGSYPDDGATGVPLDFGYIDIGMDESVINVSNNTVKLKNGNTEIPAQVDYDPMTQSIQISPTVGLMTGANYTVLISLGGATGITDLAGNPSIAASLTRSFTMDTTMDTNRPVLEFANCDDYSCAITFSESMNTAMATNTQKWPGSVINPNNYTLTFGLEGTECTQNLLTGGISGAGCTAGVASERVSFNYEYNHNTLFIEGLTLLSGPFIFTANNVTDTNSNLISTPNSATGPVEDKSQTMGNLGPGGKMGMMEGGATGFGMHQAGDMMMMPVGAWPMNTMAGATTTYFIDFPIDFSGDGSNALDDGAYVKMTFPKGFDVSNVVPDTYNPDYWDLNMWGEGIWTHRTSGVSADGSSASTKGATADDGVTVNGQTVTIWLDSDDSDSSDPDFFHFELKDIVNSTKPMSFSTDGYTVDLKSYNAAGTLIESKTSMPFYISSAGTNNLKVNIAATGGSGNIELMAGSPMTGPMDQTVAISGGAGTYTWENLPDGCYNLFTQPTITLGADKYQGKMNPDPVCLPSSGDNWSSGTSTYTKTFTLTKYSNDNTVQLPVKITGTFNAAGEDIDIAAGGPYGYSVETTTLTGAVVDATTTLYLDSDGFYHIDVVPAMKMMASGKPPMPDWMSPAPVGVEVSGLGTESVSIKRIDTNEVITDLSFTIGTADKQVISRVISARTTLASAATSGDSTISVVSADGFDTGANITVGTTDSKISSVSGTTLTLTAALTSDISSGSVVYNNVSNAEVWGNQSQEMMMSGMGSFSHAQTSANGIATLKFADTGTYEIGAFLPGSGDSPKYFIELKDNTGASDGNATSDVYNKSSLVTAASPFIIKMPKMEYTISGKVSDSNGNAIQYSHVMAEETTTHQMTHSGTDQNGSYILNVSPGTWLIKAEMPYGTDDCGTMTRTVEIVAASKSDQGIRPTATTCHAISGTIIIGGVLQANIPVMVESWNVAQGYPDGGYHRNEMTDQDGTYSIKAGNGTYRLSVWTPDYGEIASTIVVSDANATGDVTYDVSTLKTLTVALTGGQTYMNGFMEVKNADGSVRKGKPISDLSSSKTMTLPADTYTVSVFVDGYGRFSNSGVDLTSDATSTVNLSASTMYTLSGTVYDSGSTAIAGASVFVKDTSTGLDQTATTNSSGVYTMKVKEGSSYKVQARKAGYSSTSPADLTIVADATLNFSAGTALTEAGYQMTGTISQNDGTTVADEGTVSAVTSSGGFAHTSIESDGTYVLNVPAGSWTITADSYLHSATAYSSAVTVPGDTLTGLDITLTADSNDTKITTTRSVTPSVGMTMNDTGENGTGVEITCGTNVLGRSTSSGSMVLETIDLPDTDMGSPLDKVVDVTFRDSDNQDISTLNGDGCEVVFHYTDAELTAAEVDDETTLSLTYFDETTGTYQPLNGFVQDTDDNTLTGYTTHWTPLTITYYDGGDDPAPAPSPGGGGTLYRAPEDEDVLDEDVADDDASDEDVVDEDATDESIDDVVADPVVTSTPVASSITKQQAQPRRSAERNLNLEMDGVKHFVALNRTIPKTTNDWELVEFVAYGSTEKIVAMNMNERKVLLNDYQDIYGKLPQDEFDWLDLAKIAEGETPKRVLNREVKALNEFVHLFGRLVDFSDQNDEKFIHQSAYGLREYSRDLEKEKAALGTYVKAYNHLPGSAWGWTILRAIAYSGVVK